MNIKLLKISIFLLCFLQNSFAQNQNGVKQSDLSPIKSTNKINDQKSDNNNSVGNLVKIKSLMFDDEELGNIDRAISSFTNNQTFIPNENQDGNNKEKSANQEKNIKSYIHLASIVYISERDWAVWINDQKISSINNKKSNEFFVKEINNRHVKILWSLTISKWKILSNKKGTDSLPNINTDNNVEIEFSLKPNQTFILNENKIVEGKMAANQLKTSSTQILNSKQKKDTEK